MQIYLFQEGRRPVAREQAGDGAEQLLLARGSELETLPLSVPWRQYLAADRPCTRVEAHEGVLYISLDMMEGASLWAIAAPGQLILASREASPILETIAGQLEQGSELPLPCVLWGLKQLFSLAADRCQGLLEQTEERITALESQLLHHARSVGGHSFIQLRRELLALKRRTQPLEEICDLLQENEGQLLPEGAAGALAPIYRRCGRINAEIVNLENYTAQVREAYQNHLDLKLNRSMMTLTVLAAIFLPLSLIVGWYGMNFPMPELSWPGGYGYVIGLSLATLALSILFFRRRGMI